MPERVYNLYEAKTALSQLVDRAAAGEQIVIAKDGVPLCRLVPLAKKRARRRPGGWEGRMRIARNFDAPLPDEVLEGFLGARPEPGVDGDE